MAGFDWAQFCALFGAIRKGEERADDGMGKSGGTSGASRIVSLVFSFGMIAAMLLAGGLKLGQMGASVLTAFELSVVTLVAISLTMGFYTAVSSLFFSGDIAFYLALPVGGTTIVWAKLANYMAGMMVVDLAVLPLSLGVLAGRGEGSLTWVVVVLAFLLCCVAVNVALVLVALPIVRFSKLVADKDRFARVFGLVSTVFALAIVLAATLGAYDGADGVDAADAAARGVDDALDGHAEGVLLLEGATLADLAEPLAVLDEDVGGLDELVAQGGVAEVGGGHAVVNPAAGLGASLRHVLVDVGAHVGEKGDDVVVGHGLDGVHLVLVEGRMLADPGGLLAGDAALANLRVRLAGQHLDLLPDDKNTRLHWGCHVNGTGGYGARLPLH